ncbi:hypothetical protein [Anoxynatronum buryatiense]|uniref:Predicted glycosyl hydrolase, GH43/DUF377 family n=1 Tax=Anoxynatronum buryatiense TaxID=489973 RepID=A0AA45WU16_9CLOT|nr:hypothetical protein [Anoxynatronum buryatiense]SMP45628.1 Predicted glycosyl hydrolase, GH43/DUF377 family [Anoxynatronum buryatiense]
MDQTESKYQKCIASAFQKISMKDRVDLVVGIPLVSAWEDAQEMISILDSGMNAFYPELKVLYISLGCPNQSSLGMLEIYESGRKEPVLTSEIESSLSGRGWAVRGLMDIAHRMSADLLIAEQNLLPKTGDDLPKGLAPDWVKLMYQPIRDGVAQFVLPRFTLSHLANPVGYHFAFPIVATLFNVELKACMDAGMAISRQLLSRLASDLAFTKDEVNEYGLNYWLIARVSEMKAKTAEVYLGVKPKTSLPVNMNHLFSQAAHVIFQFVKKSQEKWMASPQAVQSSLIIGLRKDQFLEDTENDVRPRIAQFRRGYNRYYEAIWSRVYSEDISSQLVSIVQRAETGQETFAFPAALWTQIVYETIIAYHFIPMVDNEDLINGLAALFEGRLAGYFLEIEKDAGNYQDQEPTHFTADSFQAQANLEAQVDEFISRKNAFRQNWLHHKAELEPFLPEISYWEYIPGVPILLPHVAKSPAGNTAHVYDTYEKLLQEYSEEFKQFIRENLDLTPDAGHEKISQGIREQVGQMEEDLDEILLPGNLHNLRGVQRIADKIFRIYPSPQSMSLKEEAAIRLLRVNPPRNLITRWGYQDMEELLQHRNALDILALAPWAEVDKYSTWNTEWLRENLKPEDFEMSPVVPLVVDYTDFPGLTSMAEASSLYHLTSRVVISNLREGSGGEFPKIRFLTTTLKRIIEAEQYGKVWETFAQNCAADEFAKCVINSIGGHWGMGMFSAHAVFENTQQMILRNKLLEIAGYDWGLSGLAVERAKEQLTRMANAYHLGLTLPDGVFVTCCVWSWASYSSKGGKGIPTPLSLMVERRRFSSELFGRLYEKVVGERAEILPMIIDLMGRGKEREDLAVRCLGAVPVKSELIIDHKDGLETSPHAGKMVRSPYNPILAPLAENDWENKYVLNCGAIRLQGSVHIFYRAVGDDGISRIGLAVSHDGLKVDERFSEPIFSPANDSEKMGCEDPRLIAMEGRIYMLYTAYDGVIPQIALASISEEDMAVRNWDGWHREGLLFPGFHNKDAVLFPERFDGKLVLYHRIAPSIWITYSDTFTTPWPRDGHKIILGTRSGMTWDAVKIGAGAQPIKTKYGWLHIYHGVDYVFCYRLGVFLTSLEDPAKLIYRSPNPVLEPETSYELGVSGKSWVPNVVFTCGAVPTEDKEILDEEDELLVYYGGADTVIGVASAKVKDLIPEKYRQLP